jgi:hypothetical protein
VPAVERLDTDIQAGEFRFYQVGPSSWLQRHLINARRAPNKYGVSLRKDNRESAKKIDLAVCAAGAGCCGGSCSCPGAEVGTPGRGRVIALE